MQGMALAGNERSVKTWVAWLVLKVRWLEAQVNYLLTGVAFISVKRYGAKGDGVTDDSAAFQRAVNAVAPLGIALWVPQGTYLVKNPTVAPSNLIVWGSPAATIVMSMITTAGNANAWLVASQVSSANTGSLAANTTLGSNQISVNLALAPTAGQSIHIADASTLTTNVYVITHVAGAGPYTLTLDRAVLFTIASAGSTAAILTSQPTAIRIFGNGMTVTGAGDRVVSITAGYLCVVDGLNMQGLPMSFDIGGRGNIISNCYGDVGSTSIFNLESNQGSYIVNCTAENAVDIGFFLVDCIGCGVVNSTASNCATGTSPSTDGGAGCFDCFVTGCSFPACTTGISVGLSVRSRITSCDAPYCTGAGIVVTGSSADAQLVACSAIGCVLGFEVEAGATNTVVRGMDVSLATGSYAVCTDSVDIDGLIGTGCPTNDLPLGAEFTGAVTRLRNFYLSWPLIVDAAVQLTSALSVVRDGTVNMGTNNGGEVAFYATGGGGGSVHIDNCQVTGAGASFGLAAAAGYTLRIGEGCNFQAATNPYNLAGGSYSNRKQTVVANGASGVAVAWPDIKSTDTVIFTLQTAGGTIGKPTYTVTPGTGFTFASQALDTSTYEYFIP
jgi:Pectate lyase superfamily protein